MTHNNSAQGYVAEPRNENVLVYVDGKLVPRSKATVSIFDSGFVLGDGIWEGLRLIDGRIVQLEAHLDRLYEGATSIALDHVRGVLGKIVIRADVGLVDVSWAKKQEQTQTIAELQRNRAAELTDLNQAYADLTADEVN